MIGCGRCGERILTVAIAIVDIVVVKGDDGRGQYLSVVVV